MKKAILLAILGGTLAAASSQAQGVVLFNSYSANNSAGAQTTILGTSTGVPDGFMAQLYYALGTVSDPVNMSDAQSVLSPVTGMVAIGSPALYNSDAQSAGAYVGYFIAPSLVNIPDYTSGPITFQVVATGIMGTIPYSGRSGSWTESSIAVNPSPANPFTGMPSFVVAPVPEPTTLALAGLGGLASLVAFRRKQA